MGQCHSEKSTQVVLSNNSIKQASVKDKSSSIASSGVDRENYNIFISYCWDDKILCHSLADRLVSDGFSVCINRNKTSDDLYIAMKESIDHSDCILLCISESYFNSYSCQKAARYASDKHKTILPVAVKLNYVAKDWLSFIVANKLYYRLAGSETTFNMVYDKLTQEVLRHTRRGPSKPPPARVAPTAQEVKQRLNTYDAALLKQITLDAQIMAEVKQHIDEIQETDCYEDEQDSINETPAINISDLPALNRWIAKYPKVTWLNFPPFTPSGDINDATFLLPPDVAKDPGKVLRVWLNSYQNFVCGGFGNVTHEKARDRSLAVSKSDQALKTKESSNKQDESIVYYMKLIERHWSFNTGIAKGATVWVTIDGFIGAGLKSIAEQDRRQLLDSDLSIMKKRRQQLSAYFHTEPDTFCIFARLMRKNILDFRETCKTTYVRAIQK